MRSMYTITNNRKTLILNSKLLSKLSVDKIDKVWLHILPVRNKSDRYETLDIDTETNDHLDFEWLQHIR